MNYLGHALPIVLSVLALGSSGQAQQDQTSGDLTSPPVNAKYLQGVGTGYWPTVPATPTFTLNIAKGTAFCNGQAVTYSGGSLTMAAAPATPAAPSLSQVSGGVLPATTYYVKVTYVNASGETLPSPESNLYVNDYNRLQVASPAASGNATGWNVYVSDASTGPGTERMQNSGGPVAIGTFWTELPRGLVSGPWPPSTNTANNTNYVYLDPAASCAPGSNVTGFLPGHVPIAKVCSDTTTIYACTEGAPLLTDVRNWFVPQPCAVDASGFTPGAVACAALGNNQNLTLTPGGTGSVSITGGKLTSDTALSLTAGGSDHDIELKPTGIGVVKPRNLATDMYEAAFPPPISFDASRGKTQKLVLTDNVTRSILSHASAGQQINFLICQDGTGGHTFPQSAWDSGSNNVKGWMTIGSTASKCSAQSFIYDGANAYALSPGVTNM